MFRFHITLRCSHQLEGGFLLSACEAVQVYKQKNSHGHKTGVDTKMVFFINLVCQNGLSAASEAADGLGSQFGNKKWTLEVGLFRLLLGAPKSVFGWRGKGVNRFAGSQ